MRGREEEENPDKQNCGREERGGKGREGERNQRKKYG